MINYLVAAITGFMIFQPQANWFQKPWFYLTAGLGILFYLVFRVMAKTAQENGVAVGVVVTKMSVVIPVIVGLAILNEEINSLKIIGIVTGLIAVFLTTRGGVKDGAYIWPILLFAGSGFIDSSLKLLQFNFIEDGDFPLFSSTIFCFAFIAAGIHHLALKDVQVERKTAIGGALLGIVNFGSIFFVLKSLALPGWESSLVFPINNFGIVLFSTLVAIPLFAEHPRARVWIGMVLALGAIALLFFSK